MVRTIPVEQALQRQEAVFIDTRTPAEFAEDHLPNAINLSILSNDERAIVGTLYKQVSQQVAIDKGIELFSQKLPQFMHEINNYRQKEIIINCWRGGMRSRAITALLESLGYNVLQLAGGYKAFRAYVKHQLYNYSFNPTFVVLWGLTCTGKTALLKTLPHALDLEGLAQHRSSLYGAVGLQPRSQKLFENLLLQRLDELNDQPFVFVEGESRRIGDVIIPEVIWKKIIQGKKILIERNLDQRAKAAVEEYFHTPEDILQIKSITTHLWKVISKKNQQHVLQLLEEQQYHAAAQILLEFYYDPLYAHTLKEMTYDLMLKNEHPPTTRQQLLNWVKTHKPKRAKHL